MSNRSSPVPKDVLGKLVYRQDDLNSLKCLIAIRISKCRVDSEPTKVKNGKTTLILADGSGKLTDPFAIAWFLSSHEQKIARTPEKYGAQIMQWQSFLANEIKPFLAGLIKEGHMQRRDLTRTNNMRKVRLITALDTLNSKFQNTRYLMGHQVNLADILLAVDLTPLLDPGWLQNGPNIYLRDILRKDFAYLKEWYSMVTSKPMFKNSLNQFLSGMPHQLSPTGSGYQAGKEARPKIGRKFPSKRSEDEVDMTKLKEKPLRVLCLHGYRQNETSFREKLGAFRKLVGKFVEFTFITAPHHVLPMSNEDINQDQRGWWFSRENDYFKANDASDCDKGFDGSLSLIEKTFQLHGPFDGILGFSQGAALTTLLCLMQEQQKLPPAIKFDFAVMIASFKSLSTKHQHWYASDTKVGVPTLHVIGHEDKVIRKHLSDDVLQLFEAPNKLMHSGGHFVPSTSKQKKCYYKFLHKMHSKLYPEEYVDVNQNSEDADKKIQPVVATELEPPLVIAAV